MHPRIPVFFALFSLISTSALAADDSFVGKWKLNSDKSQFAGLEYKIEDAGGGKYRLAFGDDVETLPFDGKDHPTKFGNTWAITKTGANTWKSVQKRDGKVTSEDTWSISDGGQTFAITTELKRPDGSTSHEELKFKRTDGSSGLVGNWETTEVKMTSPATVEIAKWQGDGYSFLDPAYKERANFKLDGKDYTPTGPRVAKGTTVTAKKIDDHTMELTFKLKGKTTQAER